MYDYLVVGAGLFGAVFARQAADKGFSVLVVDKRDHIAGNVYCKEVEGIQVHEYGAHIFHTNDDRVWHYVNRFSEFNRFTNSPVANYKGELYSLPFNMYTFNRMWGVVTPQQAQQVIEDQRKAAGITQPKNLEEQAISGGHGYLRKAGEGLHRKAVGQGLQGSACIHYPPPAGALYL